MEELENIGRGIFDSLAPYPLLQAFVIVVTFVVLAKVVVWLMSGIVGRLVARTSSSLDDEVVAYLHRPIFTSVSAIGLILASYRVGLPEKLQDTTVDIIQSLLIIIWLIFFLRLARIALTAMSRNERNFTFVQPATQPLLTNALTVVLMLAGVYSILTAWDINVTGLVASAGIVGLALSFAAQDTLSNLFAGMAILADRPYRIGDFIIIDGGERGQVTHIGLRSTRLLTRDDVEVCIPNSVMGNGKIVNEAGGPPSKYRVRVGVGVAYGSDIDQVMDILIAVARDNVRVAKDPEPRARFRLFGESSLDFDLLCWIRDPADRGVTIHELNCEVYKRFNAAKVVIPFPQRDLHIKEMPAR